MVPFRARAAIDSSRPCCWAEIGRPYGQAPNCGPAWLPIHGLLELGPLPLASHHAFGPPVVVLICQASSGTAAGVPDGPDVWISYVSSSDRGTSMPGFGGSGACRRLC